MILYRIRMGAKPVFIFLLLLILGQFTHGRIHKLEIKNDVRKYIALSTFGFYKGGILDVKLINFNPDPFQDSAMFGFSLDRTLSDAMNPYLDSHQEGCLLKEQSQEPSSAVIYFTLDLKLLQLKVNCSKDLHTIHIYKNVTELPASARIKPLVPSHGSRSAMVFQQRRKRDVAPSDTDLRNVGRQATHKASGAGPCSQFSLPIQASNNHFNTNFVMYVASESEEGLYNLYFHSCPNYKDDSLVSLNFNMEIEEYNSGNYLSAGEMPLPALYFMMALLFFLSGCFWVFILRKSKHPVFKIHYLMVVLVYLKSLSLMFHGINYHFIQTKGEHVAAWAILYYIAHLSVPSIVHYLDSSFMQRWCTNHSQFLRQHSSGIVI